MENSVFFRRYYTENLQLQKYEEKNYEKDNHPLVAQPADFDGDGKTDIAVFRPSNGVWYLQQTTAGFTAVTFGAATDKPTPNAFVP